MEDTLGLNQTEKKHSLKNWKLVDGGDISRTDISQGLSENHLQVITKEEIRCDRSIIPATLMEKLSYFRAYTSTVSKIGLLGEQQNSVQRFLWFYVFNVFCKSLPMTYIYLFLSKYSPDQHLFLPKMIPLLYGYNFIFIITSFFGLALMAYNVSLYITYFIFGIIDKIPWNRCDIKKNIKYDFNYTCLALWEFAQKFSINNNVTYDGDRQIYKIGRTEYFTLAQMDYIDRFNAPHQNQIEMNKKGLFVILLLLWMTAACLRNHISKRYTWQILHRAQMILCFVYAISLIHLLVTYTERPINYVEYDINILMYADFDLLAESMTAPPVVHIIYSRSEDKVNPSLNSALINLSNSVFYILRALASYLCKKYGENWVNASLIYVDYGSTSIYISWPIYFSTMYGGDLFVLLFFALNASVDYFTFLITFQCLIQTFLSEWEKIKPWCAASIILSAAIAEYFTSHMFLIFGFIFWTCLSTLSETIIIFWLYPMGRLVDDIRFHYGVAPSKLRLWSFVFLPIFYFLKAFILLELFLNLQFEEDIPKVKTWTLILLSFLILIGGIYNFYFYIYKRKKSIFRLFTPETQWGPKSFKLRQLRKKLDFRKYIRSQAPRELSSHLIEKVEKTSYKVDIIYEEKTRRVTDDDV